MLVYRICWPQFADDLSGEGAFLYGGRWNYKGDRMLYTATNPSLALLEMLVHLPNYAIETPFTLITIELMANTIPTLPVADCPSNWKDCNPPEELRAIGTAFLKQGKSLGMLVPSVVMPKDFNLLINPGHPDFSTSARIVEKSDLELEKRLFSSTR